MPRTTETIEFTIEDRAEVVAVVDGWPADRAGWVNFEPIVHPDDRPPAPGRFRVFSVMGRTVPLCTWSPPEPGGRGPRYVSLGIQHGLGARLVPRLTELGLAPDTRWRVLSDHPKRGMVVAVPPDDDADAVTAWLLRAGEAVCPVPHRGWRAAINRLA